MIGIIDYGAGNISSVSNMISYLGGKSFKSSNPSDIEKASKLILPGVGSFDFGINALNNLGLSSVIKKKILEDKIPFLGICLGMQLFCKYSEEGDCNGLGIIDAEVKRFSFDLDNNHLKIPHMGWNKVLSTKSNTLLPKMESRFYFVHSYYVLPLNDDITIAKTNYGGHFCSAYQKDNLFCVQFHPEKSHKFGLSLMKRFMEL
tara:strand:- start:2852 stop:3460 length:609 start_codon:yes stop_codon:yes gene_type:complete